MFWQPALEELIERRRDAQPTVEVRRGVERRRRSTIVDGTRDADRRTTATAARRAGRRPLRRRLRRRQQHGARPDRRHGHRPRLLLRLADRRRRAARAAGVRSRQRADLRAQPTDHGGVGRTRPSSVGVHAPAPTRPSTSSTTPTGRGSCSSRGTSRPTNATLERHAVYRFQARWADRVARRATCCSPATPPTRCRRSPGRACARGCATRPTWRGSSTWCSPGGRRERCSTRTRSSASDNVRAVIDFSMALGQGHLRHRPRRGRRPRRAMIAAAARPARPRPRRRCRASPPASSATTTRSPGQLFVQGRVARRADSTALLDDVRRRRMAPGDRRTRRVADDLPGRRCRVVRRLRRRDRGRRPPTPTSTAPTPTGSPTTTSPPCSNDPTSTCSARRPARIERRRRSSPTSAPPSARPLADRPRTLRRRTPP